MNIKHWAPIPSVLECVGSLIKDGARVLEVGPGGIPFFKATHFGNRPGEVAHSANTSTFDANVDRMPFEDKSFDFIYCRHVVEDLYNPFNLLREMSRVGKAGYIETPSPICELTRGIDGGSPKHKGYIHHHWLVWVNAGVLNLIEKATIVEYIRFDAAGTLEKEPFLWNTYFLWNDEVKFKHLQHDIDFYLHINYESVIADAVTQSHGEALTTKSRINTCAGMQSDTTSDYGRFVNVEMALLHVAPEAQCTIDHVLSMAKLQRNGLWLEFGCYTGGTIAKLAAKRGDARLFGFDSFKGLPEDWRREDGLGKGAFALNQIPQAPDGATFVAGWFDDTLPTFNFDAPVTLVHIDCDLYSSARTALRAVLPHLVPGSIIVFDELTGYDGFVKHELKALYETVCDGLQFNWISRQGPLWGNSAALEVTAIR